MKNEAFIIFITGILFDLATTLIGIFLFNGLEEGNGSLRKILILNAIILFIAVLIKKKFEENELTKISAIIIGLFRYGIGILNTITILTTTL